MKYLLLAAVAVLAVAAIDTAHAQSEASSFNTTRTASSSTGSGIADAPDGRIGASAASLNTLLAEWDRAGFMPPSKPGQYRVYGRNGHVTSGPGYNAMVSLIRSAVNDVQEGRAREAATKIASARILLAAISPAQG